MNNRTQTPDILATHSDWVLLRSAMRKNPRDFSHAMVWVNESEMPEQLIAICKKVAAIKNLIPGVQLEFTTHPTPGYLLQAQVAWALSTPARAQQVLDSIVWEQNRLQGQ